MKNKSIARKTMWMVAAVWLAWGSVGMAAEPAAPVSASLKELMEAKVSVFDLYMDDMRTAGQAMMAPLNDGLAPILETVEYDDKKKRIIFFFTLTPDSQQASTFQAADASHQKELLARELDSLSVLVGCQPLEGMDTAMGLIQLTPFSGVREAAPGQIEKARQEVAGRTVIVVHMKSGATIHIASREPDGKVLFREVP